MNIGGNCDMEFRQISGSVVSTTFILYTFTRSRVAAQDSHGSKIIGLLLTLSPQQ